MNVSYVKTPGGEELAILPRAEFEDMIAGATHAKAIADYRSGRDPGLSASEMRELLGAATPLAFWRRKRRLSQAALAQAVGLTQNYLSDLETGKREGRPAHWLKVARALDVSLEDLIAD
jgi:DNA-binding Xre family transcriptional regulator